MKSSGGAVFRGFGSYQPSVSGSGGGGPAPGGTIRWGPDFGGVDGDRYDIGVRNNGIQKLGLFHVRQVGVNHSMPSLGIVYDADQIGVQHAMPKIGVDYNADQIGVQHAMPQLALRNSHALGVTHDLEALGLTGADAIGVQQSGSVLGAPFWQSVETAADAALPLGKTSHTVNIPAGTQPGDLLLAFVRFTLAGNTPQASGWTEAIAETSGSEKQAVLYRIATGSEGSSVTFNTSAGGSATHWTGEVHRIIGVHQTSPINATAATRTSETDPTIPSVTTTAINCLVFCFNAHSHAVDQAHSPPANHVERTEFNTGLNGWESSSHTRVFSATGATGTVVISCDQLVASASSNIRVAIRPGPLVIA